MMLAKKQIVVQVLQLLTPMLETLVVSSFGPIQQVAVDSRGGEVVDRKSINFSLFSYFPEIFTHSNHLVNL